MSEVARFVHPDRVITRRNIVLKAMFDNNDLSMGIVQAAESVTSYYILGFYSTHVALDGKFRRVKVSLAASSGVLNAEVVTRAGYYGDKEFAKFSEADKERQQRRQAAQKEQRPPTPALE